MQLIVPAPVPAPVPELIKKSNYQANSSTGMGINSGMGAHPIIHKYSNRKIDIFWSH